MTSLICRILLETSLLDDYFPFQDLHIEERVLRILGFWNKAHVKTHSDAQRHTHLRLFGIQILNGFVKLLIRVGIRSRGTESTSSSPLMRAGEILVDLLHIPGISKLGSESQTAAKTCLSTKTVGLEKPATRRRRRWVAEEEDWWRSRKTEESETMALSNSSSSSSSRWRRCKNRHRDCCRCCYYYYYYLLPKTLHIPTIPLKPWFSSQFLANPPVLLNPTLILGSKRLNLHGFSNMGIDAFFLQLFVYKIRDFI